MTVDKRSQIFESLRSRFTAVIHDDLSEATVLDLGSGPRGYVLDWAPMFGKAYASDLRDFSDAYEDTSVEFALSDGMRIDLPDDSIDIVVTHSVLEHVSDIDDVLSDVRRLLRVGGYLFATVAPLYYSPAGIHNKRQGLTNWEHLNQDHPAYLSVTPFFRRAAPHTDTGALLNKLTCSEFLAAVGRQPFSIRSFERQIVRRDIPSYVEVNRFGRLDLLTKGFVFIGQKLAL